MTRLFTAGLNQTRNITKPVRVLKGDCDIDGKCMDHTAFPATIIFVPSSVRKKAKGKQRICRYPASGCVVCLFAHRHI